MTDIGQRLHGGGHCTTQTTHTIGLRRPRPAATGAGARLQRHSPPQRFDATEAEKPVTGVPPRRASDYRNPSPSAEGRRRSETPTAYRQANPTRDATLAPTRWQHRLSRPDGSTVPRARTATPPPAPRWQHRPSRPDVSAPRRAQTAARGARSRNDPPAHAGLAAASSDQPGQPDTCMS